MNYITAGIIGICAGIVRSTLGYLKKKEEFDSIRFTKTIIISMIISMLMRHTTSDLMVVGAISIAGETLISDLANILYKK